jgi:Cu2+-exporting ATPase
MLQNLFWATGYNLVAVPLAAGVLAPVGIILPPALAAVFMSASTIVVAANAQLLRRLDLRPDAGTQRRQDGKTPEENLGDKQEHTGASATR